MQVDVKNVIVPFSLTIKTYNSLINVEFYLGLEMIECRSHYSHLLVRSLSKVKQTRMQEIVKYY